MSYESKYLGGTQDKSTILIIPDSVKTIGEMAFSKNLLTTLIIPDSVETIGYYAFENNPLTKIITYNREFNDLDTICAMTHIDKEKL